METKEQGRSWVFERERANVITDFTAISPGDFSTFVDAAVSFGSHTQRAQYDGIMYAQRSAAPIHWILGALGHPSAHIPTSYALIGTVNDDVHGYIKDRDDMNSSVQTAYKQYASGAHIGYIDTVITGRAFLNSFPLIQEYAQRVGITVHPYVVQGKLKKKLFASGGHYYKRMQKREAEYEEYCNRAGVVRLNAPLVFENKRDLLDTLVVPEFRIDTLPMTIVNTRARELIGAAARIARQKTSAEVELGILSHSYTQEDLIALLKWFRLFNQ